jgi:hypothetical protein
MTTTAGVSLAIALLFIGLAMLMLGDDGGPDGGSL